MTELLDPDEYDRFFDANGEPVRPGVVLTDEEEREFAQYFSNTTDHPKTEESA